MPRTTVGRPERLIDPEDGPVQRFAVELRELRRAAGRPSYRQLAKRAHYSPTALSEAAGGDRFPTLAVTLAYVEACGGDPDEWRARWRAIEKELEANGRSSADAQVTEADLSDAPYLGLAAFQPEDAQWFFGREGDVAQVISKLGGGRFLAVLGPSGCGKSSLVRAGVVPALRNGALPSSRTWTVRLLTPTASPLRALAALMASLAPGESMQRTIDQLRADHRSLDLAACLACASANGTERLVLVVDQLEEMFTLCADEGERAAFVANLCRAAENPAGGLAVVVAMRADFYHRCARYPRLSRLMADRHVLVNPLGTDGLRRVIEEPARHAGLRLEAGLVETILDDVADRPGALPLLSYALLEVWRRRSEKTLTVAAYVASGGVEGGLAQRADAIYQGLTLIQQRIARQVLLRLIQPGQGTEDTRRRAEVSELLRLPDEQGDLDVVLGAFADARLLTASRDEVTRMPVIEVSHEALIRGWPQLQGWIDQERELLRAHRRLTEAAVEWDEGERDEGFLYGEVRLAPWRTRPFDGLNERERAFLAASEQREARKRAASRRRRAMDLLGISVAVAIISTLVVFMLLQGRGTRSVRSYQLAASAAAQLPLDPELSLLLAKEAVEVRPTPEAEAALRQATSSLPEHVPLRGHDERVQDVVFSPDGTYLYSAGGDGTLRVWDLQGEAEPVVLTRCDCQLFSVAVSPDGRVAASMGTDNGTVRLWDKEGSAGRVVRGHAGPVFGVAFGPGGRQVVTAGADGTVKIWDVEGSGAPVTLGPIGTAIYGVAVSADGRWIAGAGGDGIVRLWDRVAGGDPSPLEGHDGAVLSVDFSADGRLLATGGVDGDVRVWDLIGGGAEPVVLSGHQGTVWKVDVSPDGRQVASVGADGTVHIWDPTLSAASVTWRGDRDGAYGVAFRPDGRRLATSGVDGTIRIWTLPVGPTVLGHDGAVSRAAFAPSGQEVATAGDDGVVRIWPATGGQAHTELGGHTGNVLGLAFSPVRRQVASGGEDRTVRVWDLDTGAEPLVLEGHTDQVNDLAFSPDGDRLASAGQDGTVRLWRSDGNASPQVLRGHAGPVESVAFSPDGRQVASGGDDGTVRLWDLATGTELRMLSGHLRAVYDVEFSPDGRSLASGGGDGVMRRWDLGTGAVAVLPHRETVLGVAFSPDGRQLLSVGSDRRIRIWQAHGSRSDPLLVLRGHAGVVHDGAFSADGRLIASASADQTVRLWRCQACGPLDDVLALAERLATRTLTPEERQAFLQE